MTPALLYVNTNASDDCVGSFFQTEMGGVKYRLGKEGKEACSYLQD
jgi:hypothetical protein